MRPPDQGMHSSMRLGEPQETKRDRWPKQPVSSIVAFCSVVPRTFERGTRSQPRPLSNGLLSDAPEFATRADQDLPIVEDG